MTAVAAVDFGASSVRVCRVTFGDAAPTVDVVHRHEHAPVHDGTHLRWDWDRLLAETERGLDAALVAGPVASIGVDTWGVDYGLLDRHGELLEPPISYRDARTDGYRTVLDRIGAERFFALAGLQDLQIDTIFQLAAHDQAQLDRARHLLMLPELVVHHLTGVVTAELSSAGTSGLVDVHRREWSPELAAVAGVPTALLPPLRPAGTTVGVWRGVPVVLVGGHDTASAVLAGATPGTPFVASGTWLLVGRELDAPDTSERARRAGLSNELGSFGGVRLLRNVAGFWLIEECRRQWGDPALDALLEQAGALTELATADALDPRFLAPTDMAGTIAALAGLPDAEDRAAITRCAIESMAATCARILAALPNPHGHEPAGVRVFGGGTRAALFLDALARHTGVMVSRGPVEAAALGNALVQAVALGVFPDVDAARATLVAPEGELM